MAAAEWAGAARRWRERVAQDIPNGSYVNLGIGIPELVAPASFRRGATLIYHTENGLLGMGPSPADLGRVIRS